MNKLYENGPAIKKQLAKEKRKKGKQSDGKIKVSAHAGMKGLCLRDLGDDIICMEPRMIQACFPMHCDDQHGTYAFITPCQEHYGDLIENEEKDQCVGSKHEWLRENWPLLVKGALDETRKRIYGDGNASKRTDRKTATA